GDIGRMKLLVAPAPGGPHDEEAERPCAQSRMERAEQKHHAKGSYRGASHRTAGSNHVAYDDLVGSLVRILFGLKELLSSVTSRAGDDARAKRWSSHQYRGPSDQCPGVRAKWRETLAVTFREFGAGCTVARALLPPP